MKINKFFLVIVFGFLFFSINKVKAEELLYIQDNSDTQFNYAQTTGEGPSQTFVSEDDWSTITKFGFYISSVSGTWTANCILVPGYRTSSNYIGSSSISISSTGWKYCVFSSPITINKNSLYEIRLKYTGGGGSINQLSVENINYYNNGFFTDYYSSSFNDFQAYKDYDARFSLYGEKISTTTATSTCIIDTRATIDVVKEFLNDDGTKTYFIPFLNYFLVSNFVFAVIITIIMVKYLKRKDE